jgi:hypothetical protein
MLFFASFQTCSTGFYQERMEENLSNEAFQEDFFFKNLVPQPGCGRCFV